MFTPVQLSPTPPRPARLATQRRMDIRAIIAVAVAVVAVTAARAEVIEEIYPTGEVRRTYDIDAAGRRNGSYVENYLSGAVKVQATYRNDRLHGKYLMKDEQGRPVLIAHYHDGKLDGPYQRFEGGELRFDRVYVADRLIYPKSKQQIRATLEEISRLSIAGSEDGEVRQAMRTLMGYRFLCDVPWRDIELDEAMNRQAAAAARICQRIGRLSHSPPNPGLPDDEYQFAYTGCQRSNLSVGSTVPGSVDMYMDDSDPDNIDELGHRRWCLNPWMRKAGFGGAGDFAAMWAHDRSRDKVEEFDFIAFPPRGFIPATHFKPGYAWHLSLHPRKYRAPKAENVQVRIHPLPDGAVKLHEAADAPPLSLNYANVDHGGYGIANAIIFRPTQVEVSPGRRYWVVIRGLETRGGEEAAIEYLVEFM